MSYELGTEYEISGVYTEVSVAIGRPKFKKFVYGKAAICFTPESEDDLAFMESFESGARFSDSEVPASFSNYGGHSYAVDYEIRGESYESLDLDLDFVAEETFYEVGCRGGWK